VTEWVVDRAATSMLAGTSYARFKNGLSKAIVSIRKPIQSFSTGGQFVAEDVCIQMW
jgi:hypothetical protein